MNFLVKLLHTSNVKTPNNLFRCLGFAALFFAGAVANASDLVAEVDRAQIYENETLTLTLTLSGKKGNAPDFSVLNRDFQILNQNQSSQYMVTNSGQTRTLTWTLTLLPRRTGKLRIPAFQIGKHSSRSMQVSVLAANPNQTSASQAEAFLEIDVDDGPVYVQQQLSYIVRLFMSSRVTGGSLSAPKAEGVIVETVGNQSEYEKLRDNRRWRVVERRYLIIPESSGSLQIDGPLFSGEITQPNRRRSIFDIMPSAGTPIHSKARDVELTIKPQPSEFNATFWLPAKSLQLREEWIPSPPEFRVGEPVTRVIRLEANGLLGTQLPNLPLPGAKGLRSYPDADETNNQVTSNGVIGSRTLRVALIPEKAGELVLPAIQLKWWDTEADQPRIARIPPRRISVTGVTPTPNTATTPSVPAPVIIDDQSLTAPDLTASHLISDKTIPKSWWALTMLLALGWLITLFTWWWTSRRHRSHQPESTSQKERQDSLRQCRNQVASSCQAGDAKSVRAALLKWAAVQFPDESPKELGSLAQRIDDPAFSTAIADLQQVLWHRGSHFSAEIIEKTIKAFQAKPLQTLPKGKLPPLYANT